MSNELDDEMCPSLPQGKLARDDAEGTELEKILITYKILRSCFGFASQEKWLKK